MKDNQFITDTIITVAETEVKKYLKSKKLKEGIDRFTIARSVASRMELNEAEEAELMKRVEVLPEVPSPTKVAPLTNILNFESASDVDQAAGMLMYKGVPWSVKSLQPAFISFEDKLKLDEAREILKRRWDFLEHSDRTVASIEFDNLDEYNKVLDFIRKSKFTSMTCHTTELSEDILDEMIIGVREGKRKVKESDIGAKDNAYDAVEKNFSHIESKKFSTDNRADRSIKVRKKWK